MLSGCHVTREVSTTALVSQMESVVGPDFKAGCTTQFLHYSP